MAGVEGTVRVHVPFSMLDICQIKQLAPFQTLQQDTVRNSSVLLGPVPSHGEI
jgi:hypothetical protein